MQSITREISFFKDSANSRQSEYMTRGQHVEIHQLTALDPPTENYRVTYALDPHGPWHVLWYMNGCLGICDNEHGTLWAPVCWLPPEWTGQDVTRKVEIQP